MLRGYQKSLHTYLGWGFGESGAVFTLHVEKCVFPFKNNILKWNAYRKMIFIFYADTATIRLIKSAHLQATDVLSKNKTNKSKTKKKKKQIKSDFMNLSISTHIYAFDPENLLWMWSLYADSFSSITRGKFGELCDRTLLFSKLFWYN